MCAMQDAVNMITHSKTRANPESNVALMTLSDLAVLVTLTTDTGKILAKLHQVGAHGQGSIFYINNRIIWRIINQNRKYFNPSVSGPGRFDL